MGMVNWKLVTDLDARAPTRAEVYGPGGSRGTSATDVAVATQIMTEMGVDSFSSFGVTSSDIKAYFDSIPLGRLSLELRQRTDPAVAAAALRLHMRPQVQLSLFGKDVRLPARRKGLLTGTSGAAILQRVPVESCLQMMGPTIERCGAEWLDANAKPQRFSVAFWSDNIFTYGRNLQCAMELQATLERHLSKDWKPLKICPKSREV